MDVLFEVLQVHGAVPVAEGDEYPAGRVVLKPATIHFHRF
jgi:hypothetical protein